MTLDLDIDPVYEEMLERINELADGDPQADIEAIVEDQIHQSYQELKNAP